MGDEFNIKCMGLIVAIASLWAYSCGKTNPQLAKCRNYLFALIIVLEKPCICQPSSEDIKHRQTKCRNIKDTKRK